MVRCHQRHSRAAQDAHLIEAAAVQHHLREAQVVERRRHAAGAARIILGQRRDIDQLVGRARRRIDRQRLG
jgi:hypothetical protein